MNKTILHEFIINESHPKRWLSRSNKPHIDNVVLPYCCFAHHKGVDTASGPPSN